MTISLALHPQPQLSSWGEGGRGGSHQVEEIASDLADHSGERGSEELLQAGRPAAVHGVVLDVIHPLERKRQTREKD